MTRTIIIQTQIVRWVPVFLMLAQPEAFWLIVTDELTKVPLLLKAPILRHWGKLQVALVIPERL